MSAARRHPASACALVTLVLALTGLLATHHPQALAVSHTRAVADLRADALASSVVAHLRVARIDAIPLDRGHDQLLLYRGPRLVANAVISTRGRVVALNNLGKSTRFGSDVANDPRLLALLAVVFVLMTAVWPVARLRNLDVLVTTSLASSVVFIDRSLPLLLVLAACPALAYLAGRCAWRGLGPARPPKPAAPLFEHLTAAWGPARQRRALRLIAAAAALVTAMVGLSSLHVVDVAYAVMEGATGLLHGVLPYGHIPDVIHGDTYPIGSYLLYLPLAGLSPVHNVWDDADLTLALAVAAALVVAWGLIRSRRPLDRGRPDPAALSAQIARLRAAIAWLCFPTALVTISTGTTDVVLAALIAGAALAWRRPAAGTAWLVAGAWFKLAPILLLAPRLAALRGRALTRALLTVIAVSAPMIAVLLALGGPAAVPHMVSAMAFQQSRASPFSLWAVIGPFPLQPLAQAGAVTLVVAGAVRMRSDSGVADDPARAAALAAAVLLTVQLAANYWSFMYLTWVAPLIVLSLLAGERVPAGAPAARRAQARAMVGRSLRGEPRFPPTDASARPQPAYQPTR